MRQAASIATASLIVLILSGCLDGGEAPSSTSDPTTSTSSGPGESTPMSGPNTTVENRAPNATLEANVTSGTAPLSVLFNISATDEDGDALSWTLTIGENVTENGTALPAAINYTFTQPGNHTIRLVVSDGTLEAQAELVIPVAATVPAAPPPTIRFTGTVTSEVDDPKVHKFKLPVPVQTIKIVLTWGPVQGLGDLDLEATAPDKKGKASEAFNTPAGTAATSTGEQITFSEEEFVTQVGEWSVTVVPFLCAQAAYTVTITFT